MVKFYKMVYLQVRNCGILSEIPFLIHFSLSILVYYTDIPFLRNAICLKVVYTAVNGQLINYNYFILIHFIAITLEYLLFIPIQTKQSIIIASL